MDKMSYQMNKKIRKIFDMFKHDGSPVLSIEPCGNGRINSSYKITCQASHAKRFEYVLQNVNGKVFADMDGLMNNITQVTSYIRNNNLESLDFLPLTDDSDKFYYEDGKGLYWRLYRYIDADVYPCIVRKTDAFKLGQALADFSKSLDGFDTSILVETISDFHDTPKRLNALSMAIIENYLAGGDRIREVAKEIRFVNYHSRELGLITRALERGEIPLRVAHNDPKLNNVLFDKNSLDPICMIDLDTVMPGSCLFDIGDAVRSIANTASEDDPTTDNVSFDLDIYEEFIRGYLYKMRGTLTDKELELIPYSPFIIAMELGIRFLTDHINGNVYFRTERDGQNLERARIQFCLAKCILDDMDKIKELTALLSR